MSDKSKNGKQDASASANEALRREIAQVLNGYSRENATNTPDWILAQYLANCLDAFDKAITARALWYGRIDSISGPITLGDTSEKSSDE